MVWTSCEGRQRPFVTIPNKSCNHLCPTWYQHCYRIHSFSLIVPSTNQENRAELIRDAILPFNIFKWMKYYHKILFKCLGVPNSLVRSMVDAANMNFSFALFFFFFLLRVFFAFFFFMQIWISVFLISFLLIDSGLGGLTAEATDNQMGKWVIVHHEDILIWLPKIYNLEHDFLATILLKSISTKTHLIIKPAQQLFNITKDATLWKI